MTVRDSVCDLNEYTDHILQARRLLFAMSGARRNSADMRPASPALSDTRPPTDDGSDLANISDVSSISGNDDVDTEDEEPAVHVDSPRRPASSIGDVADDLDFESITQSMLSGSFADIAEAEGSDDMARSPSMSDMTIRHSPAKAVKMHDSMLVDYSVIEDASPHVAAEDKAGSLRDAAAADIDAKLDAVIESLNQMDTETPIVDSISTFAPRVGVTETAEPQPVVHTDSSRAWHNVKQANRWPPILTCGLVGLVLGLAGVTYNAQTAKTSQISRLQANFSSTSQPSNDVLALPPSAINAILTIDTLVVAHMTTPTVAVPAAATTAMQTSVDAGNLLKATKTPVAKPRNALLSLPPSVSALSSAASMGLSALSTHVASAFAMKPVQLGVSKRPTRHAESAREVREERTVSASHGEAKQSASQPVLLVGSKADRSRRVCRGCIDATRDCPGKRRRGGFERLQAGWMHPNLHGPSKRAKGLIERASFIGTQALTVRKAHASSRCDNAACHRRSVREAIVAARKQRGSHRERDNDTVIGTTADKTLQVALPRWLRRPSAQSTERQSAHDAVEVQAGEVPLDERITFPKNGKDAAFIAPAIAVSLKDLRHTLKWLSDKYARLLESRPALEAFYDHAKGRALMDASNALDSVSILHINMRNAILREYAILKHDLRAAKHEAHAKILKLRKSYLHSGKHARRHFLKARKLARQELNHRKRNISNNLRHLRAFSAELRNMASSKLTAKQTRQINKASRTARQLVKHLHGH